MNNPEPCSGRMLAESASLRLAEQAMAASAGIAASRLRAARRGCLPVARARQRAMYLAHVAFGLSLTRVGLGFGRDRTTVRHACARVEDMRDDPREDFGLGVLETALVAARRGHRLAVSEVGIAAGEANR